MENVRQIKYRQWDREKKKFHYWGLINGRWVAPRLDSAIGKFSDSQQFTNIQDSAGKDIYEGDVIKAMTFLDRPDEFRVHQNLFEVTDMSDCGRASFELYSDDERWGRLINGEYREDDTGIETFLELNTNEHVFEVVGNVWENFPENETDPA